MIRITIGPAYKRHSILWVAFLALSGIRWHFDTIFFISTNIPTHTV